MPLYIQNARLKIIKIKINFIIILDDNFIIYNYKKKIGFFGDRENKSKITKN